MISVVTIWTKYIGAVHTLYQLLEEGGGGGGLEDLADIICEEPHTAMGW